MAGKVLIVAAAAALSLVLALILALVFGWPTWLALLLGMTPLAWAASSIGRSTR